MDFLLTSVLRPCFARLELIYSSNYHGRSIEMFYRQVGAGVDFELLSNSLTCGCRNPQLPQCAVAIHTVTLLEVLDAGAVLGMYATQTWHNNPSGYGDGECFLFRLAPNPGK